MINCDPNEDRAEESDEEECAQYDSADDLTEDTIRLRGIGWTPMHQKYKYKLALFEVRVGRTPFEVSAPFQVGKLFSTSSWRSFQVQVDSLSEVSAPFQGGRTARL